jgi:Tol biopolymer transport system component
MGDNIIENIAVIDKDGSNIVKLTDIINGYDLLGWQPNGDHILFMANNDNSSFRELWMINTKDLAETKVISDDCFIKYPKWSSDGKKVLADEFIYDVSTNTTILFENIVSVNFEDITSDNTEVELRCVDLSPDNNKYLFVLEEEGKEDRLCVFNLITKETKVISAHSYFNSPVWSPVEDKIAFVFYGLRIIDEDGKNEISIEKGYDFNWSPDGKKIVYSDDQNIYIYDVESNTSTYLTIGAYPKWSPDGKEIVFQDNKD